MYHYLENYNPEMARTLRDYVIGQLKKSESFDFDKEVERLKALYKTDDMEVILSEMAAESMFEVFDEETVNDLIKENRTLAEKIKDFIEEFLDFIASLPEKLNTAEANALRENTEALENIRRMFLEGLEEVKQNNSVENENAAAESNGEVKYALVGITEDGRSIYRTNYEKGTPKSVKQENLINLIQNVWSNKPIKLDVVTDEGTKTIEAKFNPELEARSDLGKIVYGNKQGNRSERRITLNLSSDFYEIASESKFAGNKPEYKNTNNPAHSGVTEWNYFVTNLVYEEDDGSRIDCYMNIDVKHSSTGDWFYSFAIKKGTAPQTINAGVTDETSATVPNNRISDSTENVKENTEKGKKYSLEDTSYLEAAENGDEEIAQEYVDKAALKWGALTDENGEPLKLYHGTQSFGFTEFDLNKMDDKKSIFLTSDLTTASTYSGAFRSRGIKASFSNLSIEEKAKKLNEFAQNSVSYKVVDKEYISRMESNANLMKSWGEDVSAQLTMIESAKQLFSNGESSIILDLDNHEALSNSQTEERLAKLDNERTVRGNYSLYAKLNNPLVIDAKGANWNTLDFRVPTERYSIREARYNEGKYEIFDRETMQPTWINGQRLFDSKEQAQEVFSTLIDNKSSRRLTRTRQVADYAYNNGYDGVIFKNIIDNGGQGIGSGVADYIVVAFNPENVKSADAVTYKDNGDVIPLSERFSESKDIRWSLKMSSEGEQYVEVDENSIDVSDGASIASNIAALLDSKFNNLIKANGQFIRVNSKTNREFRYSEWAKTLKRINEIWYRDKIKSLANADEILIAAKNWVNEDIKHQRLDNITSFGRAYVLYKVGDNGYSADVLVGLKDDGSAVLYDLINILDKEITEAINKVGNENSHPELNASVTAESITQNDTESQEDNLRYSLKNVTPSYDAIVQENEKLKETVESLKAEFKLTEGHKMNKNQVEIFANKLLRKAGSKYNKAVLIDNLTKVFEYIANDPEANYETAISVMKDIAKSVINESVMRDTTLYDEFKEMRDMIRTTRIYVPEEIRSDVGYAYGGYEQFRRRMFGKMRLVNDRSAMSVEKDTKNFDFQESFSIKIPI